MVGSSASRRHWIVAGVAAAVIVVIAIVLEVRAPLKIGQWALESRTTVVESGVEYGALYGRPSTAVGLRYTLYDGKRRKVLYQRSMPNPVYVRIEPERHERDAIRIDTAVVSKRYPLGFSRSVGVAKRYTLLMNPDSIFRVTIEPLD